MAQQVLEETDTSSLPAAKSLDNLKTSSSSKASFSGRHGAESKSSMLEPNPSTHIRKSSLQGSGNLTADPPWAQPSLSSQVVYEQRSSGMSPQQLDQRRSHDRRTGIDELAPPRAELCLVQRRILERVVKARGWSIGWASAAHEHLFDSASLTDIDLNDRSTSAGESETSNIAQGDDQKNLKLAGVCHSSLTTAASSIDQFRSLYEVSCSRLRRAVWQANMVFWQRFSDFTVIHYLAAGRTRSAERVMGDLAAVKL